MVNKVVLGNKKKPQTDVTHLKAKNAIFLNKAIRKLISRAGAVVRFTDILDGKIVKIAARCDAGSIKTIDKSKSQIGIVGMAQSADSVEIRPMVTFRNPDIKSASKPVRNFPCIEAAPIFWTSRKSERVAESSFAAVLQAACAAFGAGTVSRQPHSELLCGQPMGSVKVGIRNDQLSVINSLNGITAMPSGRKFSGTMCSLRETIERKEIRDAKHVPWEFDMADALTKCSNGNHLLRLTQYNRCAVRTAIGAKEKLSKTAHGEKYLFLQDMRKRKLKEHQR